MRLTRIPHYPVVRIETPPTPEGGPSAPAVLSLVEVDGRMWPVIAYTIEGNVEGRQRVSLTFEADVTIEHPDG